MLEVEVPFEEELKYGSSLFRTALYMIVVITVVGAFGALSYYAYQASLRAKDPDAIPLYKAEKIDFKRKPDNPGGMHIPNQDKEIYDMISRSSKHEALPKVKEILHPPEKPKHTVRKQALETMLEVKPKKQEPEVVRKLDVATKTKPDIKVEFTEKGITPTSEGLKKIAKTVPVTKPGKPKKVLKKAKATPKVQAYKPKARYRIQLGAFKSEKEAIKTWNKIQKSNSSLLGSLSYYINRADLGSKGVFYRLQAGPMSSESTARLLCKKLIAKKQGCFFADVK